MDTGFTGEPMDRVDYVTPLPGRGTHGQDILRVIRKLNPSEQISVYDIGSHPSTVNISDTLTNMTTVEDDIVCLSITLFEDKDLERVMIEMSNKILFVVSGGNQGKTMEGLMPCGKDYVLTVGSYNKSHKPASHNNKGNIDIYAPGTNVNVGGRKVSGTSIAVAFATGYVSLHGDINEVQEYIDEDFELLITGEY